MEAEAYSGTRSEVTQPQTSTGLATALNPSLLELYSCSTTASSGGPPSSSYGTQDQTQAERSFRKTSDILTGAGAPLGFLAVTDRNLTPRRHTSRSSPVLGSVSNAQRLTVSVVQSSRLS